MADGIKKIHLHYHYEVIDIHAIDYQFFMQQNSADALVLAILCDFKKVEPRAIVHEILTRLIAFSHNDSKVLREYITMLEVLASNRDLNVNIQQEFKMIEIEVERLPSFLLGEKRGLEKGRYECSIFVAKQLFQLNMPLEQIVKISGLSLTELEKLDK